MKTLNLGIDIGGTTIAYGLVNQKGDLIAERLLKTEDFNTPESLVEAIYQDLLEGDILNTLCGIGVGAPNGNYHSGSIEFAPNLNWKGIVPLKAIFEKRFNLPVVLTNDANAAALGEMRYGNAKDLNDFVLITLGTGLGSGIVINKQLVYGHDGFAGEFGHIRIDKEGRLCGCGRNGCLETYCSSTGVVRSIFELDSEDKQFSSLMDLQHPTAKNVFEHAADGDLFAQEIVEYTAKLLGESFADFACFSSPKAFVLFGGIAQSGNQFARRVKFHMEQHLLPIYQGKIEVRISSLHETNAAVLGAASLVSPKA